MNDSTALKVAAILALTALEVAALLTKTDGAFFLPIAALIGGIAGYKISDVVKKK